MEKKNFEFKPVKLHLKIDLVLHPVHVKGLGKYIHMQGCKEDLLSLDMFSIRMQ